MGAVFVRRAGKATNIFQSNYLGENDYNKIIGLMEKLDYPFIIEAWNELDYPTIQKYINLMKLPSYKKFGFKDSKLFNTKDAYNILLKEGTTKEMYDKVVDEDNFIPNCPKEEQKIDETAVSVPDKHLKGYMFDSLVYRFMYYQQKALDFECKEYKYRHTLASELEARIYIQDRHTRDLVRFIEILDEAIGERD